MGAIIGTVSGIFITKRHMLMKPNSRVKLAPTILNVNNQTAYGIGITISLDKKKKKRKPLF
jgi:cellobiose-specific phosphotransferase system component IIC